MKSPDKILFEKKSIKKSWNLREIVNLLLLINFIIIIREMDKRGQQRQQQRGAVPEEVKPLTIGNYYYYPYYYHNVKWFSILLSSSSANLPEAERAKISRLVERLVTLGREHEDIVAQQSHDKVHYNDEIKKISATMNENDTKNKTEIAGLKNDIEVLEAKCGLAYGLLKVYQEKMQKLLDLYETSKNNNDNDTKTITTLNEDIQRLEILVQDQKSSIKRYSDDAKKRDLIETSPAAKYSYEVININHQWQCYYYYYYHKYY